MSLVNVARINLLSQGLGGLARRQQAIAGNIANVDTPRYQRRDVPFEAELRASMSGGARLATTEAGHIALASGGGGLFQSASGSSQGAGHSTRNDGNNVDIDFEMAQLTETALRYQLLTQSASSRVQLLRDIAAR